MGSRQPRAFIGGIAVDYYYNDYSRAAHGRPSLTSTTIAEIRVAVQMGAATCGAIAVKRGGSMWWMAVGMAAGFLALICLFGEI